MAQKTRPDLTARLLGVAAFILGIAIILVVLNLARSLFDDRTLASRLSGGVPTHPTLETLGMGVARLIVQIALLFLGSLCGSLIATRGIHLYMSSVPAATRMSRETPEPPAEDDPPPG